jgi:acyl-coenzyme A synthetase/AMP-(fatty) acid ligase
MRRSSEAETALGARLRGLWNVDATADAVHDGTRWWSWSALTVLADEIDAVLSESGLHAGDRVGVALENTPPFVAALLAVLGGDRCLTTVSPLQSAQRLRSDLESASVGLLLASPAVAEHVLAEPRPDHPRRVVVLDPTSGSPRVIGSAPESSRAEGTAVEMLTSGTTGPPKRVHLSYRQLESSLRSADNYRGDSVARRPRLSSGVSVLSTPMVHIGGLWGALQALDNGRRIVLMERFRVGPWVAAVREHRPRTAGVTPAAIRMLLDSGVAREDLASLGAVASGAAPLDPADADEFLDRFGVPVLGVYGATEFCGSVAGWTLRDHREWWATKRGSVGRAQPGVSLRVVDGSGAPVASGTPGTLEVRSAQAAGGDDTWTRTSDLARLDEDGFLWIDGRTDDAIVRGGFKVAPATVARVLERHPAVREAAVIGRPDPRLGAVPVAAVELVDGAEPPSSNELEQLCRAALLPYEVPAAIEVVDALPRTPSMKVSNVDLLELLNGADHDAATAAS